MATRATIRTATRRRADIESDTVRFPDTELNTEIEESCKRFQGILLKKGLHKEYDNKVIVASGSSSYTLPDNFLAPTAVFEEYSSGRYRRLRFFPATARPFHRLNADSGDALYYQTMRINDENRIELFPRPNSGTYVIGYVKRFTFNSLDTTDRS